MIECYKPSISKSSTFRMLKFAKNLSNYYEISEDEMHRTSYLANQSIIWTTPGTLRQISSKQISVGINRLHFYKYFKSNYALIHSIFKRNVKIHCNSRYHIPPACLTIISLISNLKFKTDHSPLSDSFMFNKFNSNRSTVFTTFRLVNNTESTSTNFFQQCVLLPKLLSAMYCNDRVLSLFLHKSWLTWITSGKLRC